MNSRLKEGLRSFERKQVMVSFLALIFMIGLSVIYTFLYRSGQAAESARLISRMIHIQDRREAILTLQSARLDHFRMIRFVSKDPEKSFTLPELAALVQSNELWSSLIYGRVSIPIENPGEDSSELIFEFNRFAYVPWAILIWLIFNAISLPQTRMMRRRIIAQYERELEMDKQVSRMEIANIVRHNIRTPLSALMRLSSTVHFKSEDEKEVFQSVISQIRSLVSKLDSKPNSVQMVPDEGFFESLRIVIREIQRFLPEQMLLEVHIDDSLPSVLVQYMDAELKSIVENLVNNAVEALGASGKIRLVVRDVGHSVLVEVEDSGKGIPEGVIERVTEKGFSFEKPKGTGLGLYHAQECLNEWGGDIKILSLPGQGTKVTLRFPIQKRHSWYVARVKIQNTSTVIVVDDQVSIHRLWKLRLEEAGFSGTVLLFNGVEDFRAGVVGLSLENAHIFMDYDLQEPTCSGIDLLQEVSTSVHRHLVTGHFDDASIIKACSAHGLALIPKTSLHNLPLIVVD